MRSSPLVPEGVRNGTASGSLQSLVCHAGIPEPHSGQLEMAEIHITHRSNERALYQVAGAVHQHAFDDGGPAIKFIGLGKFSSVGLEISQQRQVKRKMILVSHLRHCAHGLCLSALLRLEVSSGAVGFGSLVHAPRDGVLETSGAAQVPRLFQILDCLLQITGRFRLLA